MSLRYMVNMKIKKVGSSSPYLQNQDQNFVIFACL